MDLGGHVQHHQLERWQNAEGEQDDRQIKEEMRNDHEWEIAPPQVEAGHECAQGQHYANDVAQVPALQVDRDGGGQGKQPLAIVGR